MDRGAVLTPDEMMTGLGVMEVIDTVLVLVTLALVGRVGLRDAPPGSKPMAWALAGPVLFALVCGNLLYSTVLRDLLHAPALPGPGVTLATVLLVCVQPALVEELFFRHVALGALRRELSLKATILVTSVMFAVAHLYNPLGMPYLFLAGVVFGCARVYGGLPLAMLLHFLHNLAVIMVDAVR
jgi:membrane protease YdiL (CAAX protease family)